ncbi:MAG: hypothetical protein CMJ32_08245 [Phycisphaerae bacterium]|nr:hypothetical protein [Phycisphaerae bacterium]
MSVDQGDPLQRLPLLVGACFGLVSFSVSIIVGLQSTNPAMTILLRALFALLICYTVGYVLGHLARFVLAGSSVESEAVGEDDVAGADQGVMQGQGGENVALDTAEAAPGAIQSDQGSQVETKDATIQAV